MSEFLNTTLSRVPPGFDFAEPLRQLFAWVGDQGFVARGRDGDLYGSLGDGSENGTIIELRGHTAAETDLFVRSWFNEDADKAAGRLWPFAQTGGDGSTGALWLDDDGHTRIVTLGSGSGSMLMCVLADNALDFLRLLAIGYHEIGWDSGFTDPPTRDSGGTVNLPYRDWLHRTFGVTVPPTAAEIIRHPADMGDPTTADPFCRWVNTICAQQWQL